MIMILLEVTVRKMLFLKITNKIGIDEGIEINKNLII